MSEYQRVESIALYDASMIICNDGYQHKFHEFEFEKYSISGSVLRDIAGHFGIDTISFGESRGKPQHLANIEFRPFYKEIEIYLSDATDGKVKDVFAKIDGNILTVRIIETWGGVEQESSFSYSGKFSVFWMSQNEKEI